MPRIQHKRGTSANLASANPTPLAGELVWDSTENAIKIGDGATAWTSLEYVTATPRSHVHDGADITTGTVAYARLPVGSTTSTVCAGDDSRLTDARPPTAHKATHATGGSDALTPSDIGAAPAASPAITGNATFEASSGVPVTITNTGSGNSFVVNDAAGDTTPFVVDASGRVGAGVTPGAPLHIKNTDSRSIICERNSVEGSGIEFHTSGGAVGSLYGFNGGGLRLFVNNGAGGTASETVRISPLSRVGVNNTAPASALDVNGVITVAAGSAAAPAVVASGDSNTGLLWPAADTVAISTAGVERVRVTSGGTLAVTTNLEIHGGATAFPTADTSAFIGRTDATGSAPFDQAGSLVYRPRVSSTAGRSSHMFYTGSPSTERMRIKETGAVRFVPLSADPASGEAGDVYYNSSTNKLRVYNGTSWIDLH